MCGALANVARHSPTHCGRMMKLMIRSSTQPIAVFHRGNAVNRASPIVGFATSSQPHQGMSAAAVINGDHCEVCIAMIPGRETSATSDGDAERFAVRAQVNRPKPIATNNGSVHRNGNDASGITASTAVSGYSSGKGQSNGRPGPTALYGFSPCKSAREAAQTCPRSDDGCTRGTLQKFTAISPAVIATATANAPRRARESCFPFERVQCATIGVQMTVKPIMNADFTSPTLLTRYFGNPQSWLFHPALRALESARSIDSCG
jgi:hypothetical protein